MNIVRHRREANSDIRRAPTNPVGFNRWLLAMLTSLLLLPLLASQLCPAVTLSDSDMPGDAKHNRLAAFPKAFVRNDGQWEMPVSFAMVARNAVLGLEQNGFVLGMLAASGSPDARGHVVRVRFEGASPQVLVDGENALPGQFNFFRGDASRWRIHVPAYTSVIYHDLYPGIDMRVRAGGTTPFEYDFILREGADPDQIVMHIEGADSIETTKNGSLEIACALGIVRHTPPMACSLETGGWRPVPCSYRPLQGLRVGFSVPAFETRQMMIDPGIDWSTYVGGGEWEVVTDIAVTPDGSTIWTGFTYSPDFPTTPGAFDTRYSDYKDALIVRLSPDASNLVYASFLGGSGDDAPDCIVLDALEGAVIGGSVSSADFPTTPNAYSSQKASLTDAFVAHLTAEGDALVYSTYIGGAAIGAESVQAIGLLPSGEIIAAGFTTAPDFPSTSGAFQPNFTPNPNPNQRYGGFITQFAASGTALTFSTFLNGLEFDELDSLAIAPDGSIIVGGHTDSTDFPVTAGAFQPVKAPGRDGIIARLSADGSTLLASTYLGGNDYEEVRSIAALSNGDIIAAGYTGSTNFPTTPGVFDSTQNGLTWNDLFVARFGPSLGTPLWSTVLGGAATEEAAMSMHVDSAGNVTVAGSSNSVNYPVTQGCYQPGKLGPFNTHDLVVTRLDAEGQKLYYSTFLGGTSFENSNSGVPLDVDDEGAVTVGSHSSSVDYPVSPGAFSGSLDGPGDVAITRLDMLPTGVRKYGVATPGCQGKPWASVTAMPNLGSATFGITCTNGDPSASPGLLVLGLAPLASALPAKGIGLWVDPVPLLLLIPVVPNELGFTQVPAAIPNDPGLADLTIYVQFVFGNSPCVPAGWTASNALAVTLQL